MQRRGTVLFLGDDKRKWQFEGEGMKGYCESEGRNVSEIHPWILTLPGLVSEL